MCTCLILELNIFRTSNDIFETVDDSFHVIDRIRENHFRHCATHRAEPHY